MRILVTGYSLLVTPDSGQNKCLDAVVQARLKFAHKLQHDDWPKVLILWSSQGLTSKI